MKTLILPNKMFDNNRILRMYQRIRATRRERSFVENSLLKKR